MEQHQPAKSKIQVNHETYDISPTNKQIKTGVPNILCTDSRNEFVMDSITEMKLWSLLVDTGAMISIIKQGISQKNIKHIHKTAISVMHSKLQIYSLQKVNEIVVYCNFVVMTCKLGMMI